MWKTD